MKRCPHKNIVLDFTSQRWRCLTCKRVRSMFGRWLKPKRGQKRR